MTIACTLSQDDHVAVAQRWKRLRARAGLDRTPLADGLRLRFRRAPGIERELQALVAVERACCAWADWEISQDGGSLVLHVRSAGAGVEALHRMFLEPACGCPEC